MYIIKHSSKFVCVCTCDIVDVKSVTGRRFDKCVRQIEIITILKCVMFINIVIHNIVTWFNIVRYLHVCIL